MPGKKSEFGCNYVFSDLLYGEELATDFTSARTTCMKLHPAGDLAQPRNKEQITRLAAGMVARDFPGMWIGVSDLGANGNAIIDAAKKPVWHWVGSRLPLTVPEFNWAEGQPDKSPHPENCVEMWNNGLWNDAACASARYYACELPLVSPPAVWTLDALPATTGWSKALHWTPAWAPPTFPCTKGVLERLGNLHAYPKQVVPGQLYAPPKCSLVLSSSLPGSGTHLTAAQAHAVCMKMALGGGLAVPQDTFQTRLLASHVRQAGETGMWVGLNNKGHPWDFAYYGASQIAFPPKVPKDILPLVDEGFGKPFWGMKQPDGPGPLHEFCVELWQTGLWNDRGCDAALAYACEVPTSPMPHAHFECSPAVSQKLTEDYSGFCNYEMVDGGAKTGAMGDDLKGAAHICTSFGDAAQVAEPATEEQTRALASAMRNTGRDSVWIGVSDITGTWKWRGSGLPISNSQMRWAPHELFSEFPQVAKSSGAKHCVEMWQDGIWNKLPCTQIKPWACEVPLIGPKSLM